MPAGAYTMGGFYQPVRHLALPHSVEIAMTGFGYLVAISQVAWLFAFGDGIGQLSAVIIALTGLVTAGMPFLLKRLDQHASEKRAERRQTEWDRRLRNVVNYNRHRVNAHEEDLRDIRAVLLLYVQDLKRQDDEKDQALAEDRAWMEQVAAETKRPLPPRFRLRSFDVPGSVDIDELIAYFKGGPVPDEVNRMRSQIPLHTPSRPRHIEQEEAEDAPPPPTS